MITAEIFERCPWLLLLITAPGLAFGVGLACWMLDFYGFFGPTPRRFSDVHAAASALEGTDGRAYVEDGTITWRCDRDRCIQCGGLVEAGPSLRELGWTSDDVVIVGMLRVGSCDDYRGRSLRGVAWIERPEDARYVGEVAARRALVVCPECSPRYAWRDLGIMGVVLASCVVVLVSWWRKRRVKLTR